MHQLITERLDPDWVYQPTFTWSMNSSVPRVIGVGVVAGILFQLGKNLSRLNKNYSSLIEMSVRGLLKFIQVIGMFIFTLLAIEIFSDSGVELIKLLVSLFLGGSIGGQIGRLIAYVLSASQANSSGLRDIREISKWFNKMHAFDPLDYIDVSRGVFVGLEEALDQESETRKEIRAPIYVPWPLFRETHAQILGSTGSGKGVSLGVLGYQFVLNKEALIVFDPKGDARLPLVLSLAAKQSGQEFIHLDLQAAASAQFNILEGASENEIEELLVAGLGLQPSGGEGNYYRGIDQDAAAQVSKIATARQLTQIITLPYLLEIAQLSKQLSKADNFVRRLRQVCELRVIQTTHGIGISEHIGRGNVIYIRGSTDNHRVKMLQTMLLIRILQIIKTRYILDSVSQQKRPVCMILDEFKHLLSPVALDMLGVVREMGCHALLAHQSLADLAACPGLDRRDVEPVVVDNATLKLVFRIGDEQAAKGFANKSGQQRTYKESIKSAGDGLGEDKSWSEVQHTRISPDLFLHLHRPSEGKAPFAAGVLFGQGLAKLFTLSPILVSGLLAPPIKAPGHTTIASTRLEDLI
jgi:hypothetical protein